MAFGFVVVARQDSEGLVEVNPHPWTSLDAAEGAALLLGRKNYGPEWSMSVCELVPVDGED